MPSIIGTPEGVMRRQARVITIDGAAATFSDDFDLDIPTGYIALIHGTAWLRDGNFNVGANDYEVMAFLYANQSKSGALSASLAEFEDPSVIDQYNQHMADNGTTTMIGATADNNLRTYFKPPIVVQKGRLRLYAATGGTVPSNNYVGCAIYYEYSKVSANTLATILSAAVD